MTLDPDRWTPSREAAVLTGPRKGLRVAWRYGIWRIADIVELPEIDWTDDDHAYLARQPADHRRPPCVIILRHERGPVMVDDDLLDHDGCVHVGVPARAHRGWWGVAKRYPVCSCHGDPWPCMGLERDQVAAGEAQRMARLLAGAAPGVCAHCREPIRPRQKTVTFPEPSLLVPGAPGPTFHVGRTECSYGAYQYETEHRIPAYPEVTRLASCPGGAFAFVHMIGLRVECLAGPACTGLHGPRKPTVGNCATRTYDARDLAAGYERPLSDCGYRGRGVSCLGAETGPCRPVAPAIADLFGQG